MISPSIRRIGALRNARDQRRKHLKLDKLESSENISTTITPMQDHSKHFQGSDVQEFLYKDKSPLSTTAGHYEHKGVLASLSSLKNQQANPAFGLTSEYTEQFTRETGAFGLPRLTSVVSPPKRQFEVAKELERAERMHPAQLLEENIKELHISHNEGTESDIRSELRDHIYEEVYQTGVKGEAGDTDRAGGDYHHRSSSSLTTFKHTLGLRSKASKIRDDSKNLNDTCLADPELGFLFNGLESTDSRPRHADHCFSLSSSFIHSAPRKDKSLKNTLNRQSIDDMALGTNPRLSVALSRISSKNRMELDLETATFAPSRDARGRSALRPGSQQQLFRTMREDFEEDGKRAKRGKTQCSQATTQLARDLFSPMKYY